MTRRKGCYINGAWELGEGNPVISVNPATEQIVWLGEAASDAQVHNAVQAAKNAFPSWQQTPLEERIAYLKRFQTCAEERGFALAETISQEMGKPLWESKLEVKTIQEKVSISIEAYNERCAERHLQHGQMELVTRHKGHGVLAVLGPFNFPCHLPNGHIVPALLAGNTIVFKPSERTPLSGILYTRLWEIAELPRGVFNCVQGGAHVGTRLAAESGLSGLLFTGSASAGQRLAAHFGLEPSKILALEMGGNNPLIVYEPDDTKKAAYLTAYSAYLTSGQRCTAARRLIVPKTADADAFIAEFTRLIETIQVGPYTQDPEPFMGPLVSVKAAEKILQVHDQLLRRGAKSVIRMRRLGEGGAFVTPALLDVSTLRGREDREFFGPLLQLIRVKSLEEAIREACDTEFGLAAAILTRHREAYESLQRAVKAGVVNWNAPTTGASSRAPFGGVGLSGNHRPTALYAADTCAYPVASMESSTLQWPSPCPGLGVRSSS